MQPEIEITLAVRIARTEDGTIELFTEGEYFDAYDTPTEAMDVVRSLLTNKWSMASQAVQA